AITDQHPIRLFGENERVGIDAFPEPNSIAAPPQRSVDDRIVAVTHIQNIGVVARTAAQHVIAATTADGIVAATTRDTVRNTCSRAVPAALALEADRQKFVVTP